MLLGTYAISEKRRSHRSWSSGVCVCAQSASIGAADENLDVDTHSDSGESDPLSHTSSRLPVGSIGASVSDIATALGER